MPIKKDLLEILACPAPDCHGNLTHDEVTDSLNCRRCRRRYPIRDGIPVMLLDEATIPDDQASAASPAAPESRR